MGLHFHLRSADRQHIAPEAVTSISALSRGNKKKKKRLMSDRNIVGKPKSYPGKDTDVCQGGGGVWNQVNRILGISDRLGVAVSHVRTFQSRFLAEFITIFPPRANDLRRHQSGLLHPH